ncbi:hypothetical protein SASPL_105003 [Salvia splendens]|uniref:Polygalacturonase n=1 Tax=Salvia splendens TaxID=180675 RepID=A0A8X8YKH1_SALSN|nr:hypothetical protein SASPL_105003 [Salvia splendens]
MALRGHGLIDGRGQAWWDLPCKPHKARYGRIVREPCDSTVAIRFFMSNNIRVEGIRLKNSPQFHFRFDGCQNVHIQSIYITAPPLSPNTDGIHIENTINVEIYNSVVSNSDDCVSIGSGCYDVDIRNMTCGPSHGISIGSLGKHNSRACASNITVCDSVIKNSDNWVRIKTWQGGSGAVSGVIFRKIHMENVRNPIIIDQFYCLTKNCSNGTSAPPVRLKCSDAVPCTNITIGDVELLPSRGALVLDPFCWNAYGEMHALTIPPVACLLQGFPRSVLESDVGIC